MPRRRASALATSLLVLMMVSLLPGGAQGQGKRSADPYSAVQTALGARFGGIWLTDLGGRVIHSAGPEIVHVAVVGASPRDAVAIRQRFPRKVVQLTEVHYSQAELEAFAERLVPFVIANKDVIVSMGPRTELNQVEVIMSRSAPALVVEMQAVVPSRALLVTVRPGERVVAADSRTTYPPYKGGRKVDDVDRPYPGFCTTGFDVILNGSGLDQGTIAGHCGRTPDHIKTTSTNIFVGITNLNFFFSQTTSNVDIQLIGLDSQSHYSNFVYVSSTFTRSVIGKLTTAQMPVGTLLYFSGAASGMVKSGNVTQAYPVSINENYQDPDTGVWLTKTVLHEIVFSAQPIGGDSGSGVYQGLSNSQAKAAGGLNAFFNESGNGIFNPITTIETYTGTLVRTGP